MKIAFFEIEDWEKPYLQEKFSAHTLSFYAEHLSLENISSAADCDIISIFIYSEMTKELLEKFSNLKLIVTRSTGFDHIDLAVCKEKNISVANVPVYGTHTVAEHTFALLLAISRKLIPSIERARQGDFSLDGLRGFDLEKKTLGIIGFGNIGQEMTKIAKGFDMNVIAFTPHPKTVEGVEFVDLDTLLARADVVSLHVPYTKETHHIINKENITKFKKGAVLLNTARGGLIETEAILIGLDSGNLIGVGIDVLEEECYIKEERQLLTEKFLQECDIKTQLLNHVLLTKENVLVTPHNAFNSTEALQRILDVTVEDIQSFISGSPVNVVKQAE